MFKILGFDMLDTSSFSMQLKYLGVGLLKRQQASSLWHFEQLSVTFYNTVNHGKVKRIFENLYRS